MDDRKFTLPELASLVRVEYRTLHTWVRRGLLAPSCQQADGSGTRNLFDESDARDAYVLADLRRSGVELSSLDDVAEGLRRAREDDAPDHDVLLINGCVSFASYAELAHAIGRVSPTLVYDLDHASSGVRRRVEDSI